METSILWAQIMGPLFVLIGLGHLFNLKRVKKIIDDAVKSPALIYFAAFIMLALGILMVLSHNIWVKDWTVVVTILAWVIFFKGFFLLFSPDLALKHAKKMNKSMYPGMMVFVILVGVYLSYFGFFA